MSLATLIPAFRLPFFTAALNSVVNQVTRPNLVIVSDDSHDNAIIDFIEQKELVQTLAKLDINLCAVAGPKKGRAYFNVLHLSEKWNKQTEYFHYLMDDDLIYPSFYREHLSVLAHANITCSISRRWRANSNGHLVGYNPIPQIFENINQKKFIIGASEAYKTVVPQCHTWMGELSNAVFHKTEMTTLQSYEILGFSTYGLGDIGVFLSIAHKNKLGFIDEHLGFFRVHDNQNTGNLNNQDFLAAHLAWIAVAIAAFELKAITEEEKQRAIKKMVFQVFEKYLINGKTEGPIKLFEPIINDYISTQNFPETLFMTQWSSFTSDLRQ